jgi:thiol-disulfide isomerase/thioredoxin
MNNMLKLRTLIAQLVLILSFSFLSFGQGIQFTHEPFSAILTKAKSENKLVFLDAYTTWCGPCKWMAKTIFVKPEVGDYFNTRFVNAKIDMEKGEGIELARRFQVEAYPTLLFLNGEGEVVHRSLGAREADGLIQLGNIALDPQKNLAGLKKAFWKDSTSFAPAYAYLSALKDAEVSGQKEVFEAYFRHQPESKWMESTNWRMLHDFIQSRKNPLFQYMVQHRSEYESKFGKDSVSGKIRDVLFAALENAASQQNPALWEEVKAEIEQQNLPGAKRAIALTYAQLPGEDMDEVRKRMMLFAKDFSFDEPGELAYWSMAFLEGATDKAQLKQAEQWSAKAASMVPDNYTILDTWAHLLEKNGNKLKAKEVANRALKAGKQSGDDVSSVQELLKRLGSTTKAKPSAKTRK